MEISPWTIYLIGRLDAVAGASAFAALLSGFGIVICVAVRLTFSDSSETDTAIRERLAKWSRRLIAPFVLSVIIVVATPSTTEAYAIWLVPAVANSDEVRRIRDMGGDVLGLIEKKIDEALAKPGKKED